MLNLELWTSFEKELNAADVERIEDRLVFLKEILEEERVEDLESIIKLIDIDNMAINVFLPKENQKEQ